MIRGMAKSIIIRRDKRNNIAEFIVDGAKIDNVVSYKLEESVDSVPHLTLEIVVTGNVEVDFTTEDVAVSVNSGKD